MMIYPRDRQILIDDEREIPLRLKDDMIRIEDNRTIMLVPKNYNIIFLLKK